MSAPERLTFRESRTEPRLVQRAAALAGTTDHEIVAMFGQTARRLRDMLRLKASPFDISISGTVRVDGIAGLLRMSTAVELQVVPKFLDPNDADWQEDFFLLALFSQTGRILPREHIRAGGARRGDLASLVGQTLAQMYWENHRRPIRTYTQRLARDFAYDGEVDPLELVLPDPDGFEQSVLQLRRDNQHNAVLVGAVIALLPEVRDAETRKKLLRVQQSLAPQPPVASIRPRELPARSKQWQPAVDLALEVLKGFGVGFQPDHMLSPGFVLRTWSTWQALVEAALRTGLNPLTVLGQQGYNLGTRSASSLDVTPDVVVADAGTPRLVVDAKYRTRGDGNPSIAASDVYESLAFLEATQTETAVLLYPRPAADGPQLPVGTATQFETATIGSRRVVGVLLEVRGISAVDGYGQFAKRAADAVRAFLPQCRSAS